MVGVEEILKMGQPPQMQPAYNAPGIPQMTAPNPAMRQQQMAVSPLSGLSGLAIQAPPIQGGGIGGYFKNRWNARMAQRLEPIFRNQVLSGQAANQQLDAQLKQSTLQFAIDKAGFETEKANYDAGKAQAESVIATLKAQNTPQALELANQLQTAKIAKERQLTETQRELTRKAKLMADYVAPLAEAQINQRNAAAGASNASAANSYAGAQNKILARPGIIAGSRNSVQAQANTALDRQIAAEQANLKNLVGEGINNGFFNASGIPFEDNPGEGFNIMGLKTGLGGDPQKAAQYQQLQGNIQQSRQNLNRLLQMKGAGGQGAKTTTRPVARPAGKVSKNALIRDL